MAAVVSLIKRTKNLSLFQIIALITFDSSYPTGGESILAAQFGLQSIDLLQAETIPGYEFDYDYTTSKLKALTSASGASQNVFLSHGGKDIKGSANTDSENADAASLPTNGSAVAASATVAAAAWAHGALTSPGLARNVGISILNDSGGALNLYEGVMTFTVTGTWRGAAQTETITVTSTLGNKSVANNKYRYKYGVKPFDTVTDITLDHVPADGIKISAGLGSKIGLPTNLKTPVEADVTKITKNAADLAVTGLVNTANNTVNLGVLADGDDFNIVYLVPLATSVIAGAEVPNTTDLSTVSLRVMVHGT